MQRGSGGSGGGGACSHQGVVNGNEVTVVNATGQASINTGDLHYVPGRGAGGQHGRNAGGAGLAVLVLPGGRPPIVLDKQGEHTIPFPAN
jgi:hypothetical protein